MKEGWKTYQFGELVTFDKRFKGIDRAKQKNIVTFNHVSAELLKSLPVDGGDVKLLATGLFDGYTTTEKAAENLNNGEVITIPTGGNANIKYYKGLFVDSGNILAVSNREDINLKYVWYYLLFQNEFLESCFKGTSIKHPYMPDIWELDVPVPPISEQKRIVSYLDAQFAKIDALKANTEQQLQAAKDLFQSALKEMLTPKEGWDESIITSIVRNDCSLSYGIVQPGDGVDCGVPVVRPVDITNRIYVGKDGLKKTTEQISNAYKRTILKGNEILLCVRGTTGLVAIASRELEGCNVTRGIVPIRLINRINKKFIYYTFLTPAVQNEFARITTGSTLKQINIKDLRELTIPLPSLPEQERIAARLDAISEKVKALQANYDQTINLCNDLKQSLLKSIFA